jgi:hypothetical protein
MGGDAALFREILHRGDDRRLAAVVEHCAGIALQILAVVAEQRLAQVLGLAAARMPKVEAFMPRNWYFA